MQIFKYFILLFLLITTVVHSKTYEDGEDRKSNRWRVLSSSLAGKVSNIYDKNKASRVIQLKGKGTKSAYMLMNKKGGLWNNKKEHVLHWEMKYGEDFVIIVGMDTKKGKRYLLYTAGEKGGYMQYGLGMEAMGGTWQRYTRNLQKDLEHFENYNTIKSVETFVIRGSGYVDNIKLLKKRLKNKEPIKKENVSKKKKILQAKKSSKKKSLRKQLSKKNRQKSSKKEKIVRKYTTNTTPTIYIQGANPLYLEKGEVFIDPGVTAKDKEDGMLQVISRENIDNQKDGRYSVIYMATDSQGNSAVDTRYIEIGSGEESHAVTKSSNEAEVKPETLESEDDIEFKLEERELEISEWEKELELREKEISQRENAVQNRL